MNNLSEINEKRISIITKIIIFALIIFVGIFTFYLVQEPSVKLWLNIFSKTKIIELNVDQFLVLLTLCSILLKFIFTKSKQN